MVSFNAASAIWQYAPGGSGVVDSRRDSRRAHVVSDSTYAANTIDFKESQRVFTVERMIVDDVGVLSAPDRRIEVPRAANKHEAWAADDRIGSDELDQRSSHGKWLSVASDRAAAFESIPPAVPERALVSMAEFVVDTAERPAPSYTAVQKGVSRGHFRRCGPRMDRAG